MESPHLRLTLLGVGAMRSPRHRPAGLLIEAAGRRVAIDGGPGAEPPAALNAWLLTDARAELAPAIRRLAWARGLDARVESFAGSGLRIDAQPVAHTSHPAFGYLIWAGDRRVIWAPEFWEFPAWAAGASLMFAEASSWDRPIRFAGGVGGHAPVLQVAEQARRSGVRRLVLAHLGRPTVRAIDAGSRPPFGEVGRDGACYRPHGRGWRVERPPSAPP